jgi:single-stranded-DNA-specific exonuclease
MSMTKYALKQNIPVDVDMALSAYHPFVRSLLHSRGITDTEAAEKFLNPNYDADLHDPFLLKGMDKAVKRILKAIDSNEKIGIFSDYDADGIPGAVVLHDFFKKIGYTNFVNYIPLRNEEGFGLSVSAIENLVSRGVKLIITIDCGITDVEEVAAANEAGVDVIITDHHLPAQAGLPPKDKLPKAFAIVNPKQKGDGYPEKMLCGSGVIFKVIQALILEIRNSGLEIATTFPVGWEKWLLDMVGLATLSDMVPLLGENRTLAHYGMKVLQKSPRAGLQKLFSLLKINQKNVTEDDIAFMITPRVNAASRMGVPRDAFLLLSTTDEVEAGMLAQHLNEKNDERKGVVAGMVKEVKKKMEARDTEEKHVLVFGNPEWKPSLLGLVAGSFSDEHEKPVFFWGRNGESGEEGIIKGSCRSSGDVNVVRLMEKVKDIFVDYGGHHGAGGFSLLQENIHTLEERLNKAFEELSAEGALLDAEENLIDKKISLDDVNWDMYSLVEKFMPFGFENPKPQFLFENVEIAGVKLFGKEQNHLELKFRNSKGKDVTAIAFFCTDKDFDVPLKAGKKINMVSTMEKSTFRNFPELRLRIVDLY